MSRTRRRMQNRFLSYLPALTRSIEINAVFFGQIKAAKRPRNRVNYKFGGHSSAYFWKTYSAKNKRMFVWLHEFWNELVLIAKILIIVFVSTNKITYINLKKNKVKILNIEVKKFICAKNCNISLQILLNETVGLVRERN